MDTRIAIVGIIIDEFEAADEVNHVLHEAGAYIVGRMGIPYREKGLNIISVVVDAPQDVINSLAGKLGRIPGVTAKAVYSKC